MGNGSSSPRQPLPSPHCQSFDLADYANFVCQLVNKDARNNSSAEDRQEAPASETEPISRLTDLSVWTCCVWACVGLNTLISPHHFKFSLSLQSPPLHLDRFYYQCSIFICSCMKRHASCRSIEMKMEDRQKDSDKPTYKTTQLRFPWAPRSFLAYFSSLFRSHGRSCPDDTYG